jgi:hypothetical protein
MLFPLLLLAACDCNVFADENGLQGCDDTLFGVSAKADDTGWNIEGTDIDAVEAVLEGPGSCFMCHGTSGGSGGLSMEGNVCAAIVDVDSENYPGNKIVASGSAADSVLWHKMNDSGDFDSVMPTSGKIDQSFVDIIETWIDNGASCESDEGSE